MMESSSRGVKSFNCGTTLTLRSTSGRTTSTTAGGTKRALWEYMTFLTDVEEVDVDIEEFNELVGYDETYRPQGFTRVADKRLDQLAGRSRSRPPSPT